MNQRRCCTVATLIFCLIAINELQGQETSTSTTTLPSSVSTASVDSSTSTTVGSLTTPSTTTGPTSTTANTAGMSSSMSTITGGSTTTHVPTMFGSTTVTSGSSTVPSSTVTGSTVSSVSSTVPSSTVTGSTVSSVSSTVPSSTVTGSTVSSVSSTVPSSTVTGSTVSSVSSTVPSSTVTGSSTSVTTRSTVSSSAGSSASTVSGMTANATTTAVFSSLMPTTPSGSNMTTGAGTVSTENSTSSTTSVASTTTTSSSTTRTSTTVRSNSTNTTTTVPPTFPPLTRDGVNQCRKMETDSLLANCVFYMAVSMAPPNDSTLALLKNGATYYLSQDNPDEIEPRNYILGLGMEEANTAMMSTVAVLTAQRVRAAIKNAYLTQASDLGTGVGDTVADMAAGYLQGMNLPFDRDAAGAILLLFEKQLTSRPFNIALRNMQPLYMRAVMINLETFFIDDYNNLTSTKSQELIREVSENFYKRLEANYGSAYSFFVRSLTKGSVEVNAEVTYDMTNPNGTDPIDATAESFKKDPSLGNFTVNPDRSNFGSDATFEDKLMSNKGQDKKMIMSITLPAFAGLLIFIIVILCCTSMAKAQRKSEGMA